MGQWHVVEADAKCVEIWDICADGTTHNIGACEESYSEYPLPPFCAERGYYMLTDTITKTNGQPDCTGRPTTIGDRVTLYLVPLSNVEFNVCLDPMVRLRVAIMTRTMRPTA